MAATKTTIIFSSACIMLIVFISTTNTAKADELECLGTFGSVVSCEEYLTGKGDQPEQECCSTLQDLDNIAMKSLDDQKRICQCLENAIKAVSLYPQRLNDLNSFCGVSYLPNDPNFDCSR
ncbi:hypothetical protein LIER_41041 [Lithospermum erythrorhizon]|uniref:Bifunctional inhibitor/plant lipid transfer protein/seed storage helical domain-containing protein n=1 Tax=Lithospermum erythrorhizon TaxID=34254 RepID=A0AAV3R7L5_LITER